MTHRVSTDEQRLQVLRGRYSGRALCDPHEFEAAVHDIADRIEATP
ncbi:hypothetical protein [Micromonospora sp. LOL_024]